MKRYILLVLILTALALNLTGCANDIETFESYVRQGNYAEAIPLYQEKLMDDLKDSLACRELVETYLTESLEAYRQGELTQSSFDAVLETMYKLEDHLYLVDNLEEITTQYRDVKDSKTAYRRAEALRNEGRLEDAVEAYSTVLPEDGENFSTARENMEQLLKQMEDEARNAIVQAYESKDYPAVFQACRQAEQNRYITTTAELTEIREAARMEYLYMVENQAQEAFRGEEKDYNAALEILRAAKAAAGDEPAVQTELDVLVEHYNGYIPVSLAGMKPVQKTYYVDVGTYESEVYTDINGNTHDKDSVISATGTYSYTGRAETDEESSVVYNLNFAYSTFRAAIYRPYVFLSYTGELTPGRCVVKIYGDDILLYEFFDPCDSWDVIPLEVDVSGVRNLRIVIRGCWNSATGLLAPPDWTPGICLADGVLQK